MHTSEKDRKCQCCDEFQGINAIWLYVRLTFSFRDIRGPADGAGIMMSYETVRRWVKEAART